MILLLILALILIILVTITIGVISVGGAIGVILFGDVIVCIIGIVFLMKWLISRRK